MGNDDPVASVPGEVVPNAEFYDYRAKYLDEGSELVIPAPLSGAVGAEAILEDADGGLIAEARTDAPPFRTAAFPGPTRTTSSKTTSTRVGAFESAVRSAGTVRTSVACADAEAGTASAASATRKNERLMSRITQRHGETFYLTAWSLTLPRS